MNKTQRKRLKKLSDDIEGISEQLQEMLDEEQFKFDNMPEGVQESERGEAMEDAIEGLESAIDSLDEAVGYIEEVVEG